MNVIMALIRALGNWIEPGVKVVGCPEKGGNATGDVSGDAARHVVKLATGDC